MALTPNPPGSQYWLTTFSNPKTGANRRIALYAATAEAANSRLRAYLASNPFGLGATDQQDFMSTWSRGTHSLTPSGTPPDRQGGDIYLDFPTAGAGGGSPPGGGGAPPGGGTPPGGGGGDLNDALNPDDKYSAYYLRGLAARLGVGSGDVSQSIAGRAQMDREGDYLNPFRFQNQLAGDPAQADPSAYQGFVNNTNSQGLAQEAWRAFQQMTQQGPARSAGVAEWQKNYSQPDDAQAGNLARLASQALRSRYSPLALEGMRLPTGSDLRTRWIADTGGDPDDDFLTYLRDNYPLLSGM